MTPTEAQTISNSTGTVEAANLSTGDTGTTIVSMQQLAAANAAIDQAKSDLQVAMQEHYGFRTLVGEQMDAFQTRLRIALNGVGQPQASVDAVMKEVKALADSFNAF